MSDLWRFVDDVHLLEKDVRDYIAKSEAFLETNRSYERRYYTAGRISAYRTILKRLNRLMARKPRQCVK